MKNLRYTLAIVMAVIISYFFPQYFLEIGGFKLSKLIIPLLQIIMVGMGTTMTIDDFAGIIKTPKAVVIGVSCHFLIMPMLGFSLAKLFGFPPEIAAGVILIGCSPSGLASNVMALIAKANVPLSITITTFSTLLSPIFTPLLMKIMAGELVEVHLWSMVWDVIKIIILPIGIGLCGNLFFKSQVKFLHRFLPSISMIGIALIIVVITAAGQASLQKVGFLLIICVLIHNLGGYILGFMTAKIFRMPVADCRAVAFEVGMQNGGLASGLANEMGKLATVGLAPALFGPIMNVTGSLLASWWGRKEKEL